MLTGLAVLILVMALTLANNAEDQESSANLGENINCDLDAERREICRNTTAEVAAHNEKYKRGEVTYQQEVNMFAFMKADELTGPKKFNAAIENLSANSDQVVNVCDLPEHVDWKAKGYVTAVKNQGQCGGCWAFATTGAIESHHAIATGKLVSLSESHLLDCCKGYGCGGCDGGGKGDGALDFVVDNGGIATRANYPYHPWVGKCKYVKSADDVTISGSRILPQKNEDMLQFAVHKYGPIMVNIQVRNSFVRYKSGIYYDKDCTDIWHNHAVLIVGYGVENDVDYWLVKNSWGKNWGENGYIRMAKHRINHCGIANTPIYPIIEHKGKSF